MIKNNTDTASEIEEAIAAPAIPKAEYQDIIQHHIRQHHHDRVGCQYLSLGDTDIKRPEHHRYEREEEPIDTPVDIAHGRLVNFIRADQLPENHR